MAVIPPGAALVSLGGQNAVNGDGRIVGVGDDGALARQVKANGESALEAAGCGWGDAVRDQVLLRAGLASSPPLVMAVQVVTLAHPDFLFEVAVEAVRR